MFIKQSIKRSVLPFIVLTSILSTSSFAEDSTFSNVCSDCHTGGFKGWISGAPNVNKSSKWDKFLNRHTVEEMKEIILDGSDDHKRKGGCKTCSAEDIESAVDYMLILVSQKEGGE